MGQAPRTRFFVSAVSTLELGSSRQWSEAGERDESSGYIF